MKDFIVWLHCEPGAWEPHDFSTLTEAEAFASYFPNPLITEQVGGMVTDGQVPDTGSDGGG